MNTKRKSTRALGHSLFIGACCLVMSALFATGCPSTPTPSDGGEKVVVPDTTTADKASPLTCSPGTACLQVGNDLARVCDVLLNNDSDIAQPEVGFDANATGQFKYMDTRLALSFLVQKDEAFGKTTAAAVIKTANGVDKLSIAQATCYDSKGKKIEKPDVALRRP